MDVQSNINTPERIGRAAFSLLLTGAALKKGGKLAVLLALAAGNIMSSAISGYDPLRQVLGPRGSGCPCGSGSESESGGGCCG